MEKTGQREKSSRLGPLHMG
ncbi:hypothetical protein F383_05064 [Gossypium arboreum]|uniref:Uncharacterized protein n=1 Tax=Gossypium arboreum TaxID=29729 RepID=A0A0B0MVE4_GOSAR|nr:hypothetical protein F383_06873 [Gossypium arboreum]KHG03479.1 hypothetical protein F383_10603 [Gossypium arboreum]KHG16975.1 hypothetical protein F383_10151 [Gossypium arboreum]KHG18400.1 hypothetical protein F383_05064 [Gossypium arboreum]